MDRYVKKKQIGEGSFGKALLVKHKEDGKEYVIKEINISKMKRKEREESKKEVSVLKKMRHPNIVSYAESFEERGNLYIVMDYCDGGDLFQAINRRRGVLFPEDEVLDWFVQICLALKHVHDRKILHRDIKSQNIFLTRKGIIKLGDFGIARVLNSTMELARTCIGTPYYLSPEICENNPYNNKSDIWALGCVLYELLTLKHAFEAGNMKNLVLKIIRGSYPPVSPRYSYEIRNLVAQLFKRNPRDRPSVNSVLKKPFIQRRIERFLTDAEVNDEFSHTVLHRNQQPGIKRGVGAPVFQKPAQLPPRHANAAAKKPPVAKPFSNPAAKYGPSVAVKRPPSGQAVRKSQDKEKKEKELEQKKRELIEKEKERRLKERQVKIQQQQLINKQRMAHINKAREAGWRNTLLSSGSSNGGGGGFGSGGGGKPAANGSENDEPPKKEAKYDKPALYRPAQPPERGNYDRYHQQLDNLRQDAQGAELGQGGAAMFREERERRQEEAEALRRQMRDRPVSASGADAARRGLNGRQAGAEAADRARMVNEFLSRKREAAANKARAAVQLGWAPPGAAGDAKNEPLFPYSGQKQHAKNREEQAYLDQLKAIRMQNYQERLNVKNKGKDDKPVDDPRISADARRKKIEALKAQADERAAKLKEQLERQRRDAYEKEKRAWDDHLARKRVEKPVAASKPLKGPAAPVMPLTAVLKDVGVDMEEPEKDQEMPAVNHAEKKRESPPEEKQAPAAPRKHWLGGETKGSALANLPLEETASNMEATSAADIVTRNPSIAPSVEAPGLQANRKKWGAPGSTVVNALQMAEIKAGTMTIAKAGEEERGPSRVSVGSPMGVTIIKDQPVSARDKLPVVKGPSPDVTPSEVRDSVSLEVIDGRNPQDKNGAADASKQGEERKALSQSKPAWTADQVEGKQTQADAAPRIQAAEEQKDQAPPTSPTKDSPKADAPPTSPAPSSDAPPTSKVTPPKSPRPSSLTKKSPTSATAPSPKSQEKPEGVKAGLDGEEKEEEKEKFLEKVPRKEEAVSPKQDKKDALDVVDLEEEEEEDEETIEEHKSAKKKMISGLSTGVFDTAPKLLRTCSDPDLRQLFRTTLALNPFFEAEQQLMTAARSVDMAAKVEEDDDEEDIDEEEEEEEDEESEELIRQLQQLTAKNEEEDEDEDDEEEEEEEEEREGNEDDQVYGEDDEYQNLVESMKSLLEARDAAETPENEKRQFEDGPMEEEDKTPPSSPSEGKDEGEEEEEEEEEEEDDKEDSETKPINENWDSGEGSEGEECGMSTEERESVFSRLEESRLQLEKELGCDTFLNAYKTIQAIHEDEDENIEEGTKRVNQILGEGKAQLYTKILQLVMADGAYTEDNDDDE